MKSICLEFCCMVLSLVAVAHEVGESNALSKSECSKLAKLYIGKGDYASAFPFAQKGDLEDPELLGELGVMYYIGEGPVVKNESLATNYLFRAFFKGYLKAGLFLAEKVLLPKNEFCEARKILEQAVKLKSAKACCILGDLEMANSPSNIEEAGKWYMKAVDGRMAPSPSEFATYGGWLFSHKPHQIMTCEILKRAADAKVPSAQILLGHLYARGGVDFDSNLALATKYYKLASENSMSSPLQYGEACARLCMAEMVEGRFAHAKKMLKNLFSSKKTSRKNKGFIATVIVSMHMDGDMDEAWKWANEAKKCGNWDGIAMYGGRCEMMGDREKARQFFLCSATNGSAWGMASLSQDYLARHSCAENDEATKRWAKAAIEMGLKNSEDLELLPCARELASSPMGIAYAAMGSLEGRKGNDQEMVKLALEGKRKAPLFCAQLDQLLVHCIRRGLIRSSVVDLKDSVLWLRNCCDSDSTGMLELILAEYLEAHPSLMCVKNEDKIHYNRSAQKGNSGAIVHLYGEMSVSSSDDKMRAYKLLMSAKKLHDQDKSFELVQAALKAGAAEGWWSISNEKVPDMDSKVSSLGEVEDLVTFSDAWTLMWKGLCQGGSESTTNYCKMAKGKLLRIKDERLIGFVPACIASCDLMCGLNVSKSLRIVEESVDKGNLYAAFFLSVAYAAGINVTKNLDKAQLMLKKIEENDLVKEGVDVGEFFTPEKIESLRKLIDFAGHEQSLWASSPSPVDFGNTPMGKLMSEATEKAAQGDARAELELLVLYKVGASNSLEYEKKAEEILEMALLHASTKDLYEVAKVFYSGIERPKWRLPMDWPCALKLFKAAADKGCAAAANDLALMYENGEGCKKNMELAFRYFLKAATLGQVEAQISVGNHYEYFRRNEKDALKKALSWYKKALAAGSTDAPQCVKRVEKLLKKGEKRGQ